MSYKACNTLIISDLHLGSEVTRVKQCRQLLAGYKVQKHRYLFKRLILLGDIFDSMDLRKKRVRKWEWKFLGDIRAMTDPEAGVEVVWIIGNHDPEITDLLSNMVGADAYHEYRWQLNQRNFFAMHGDQFDRWIFKMPKLLVNLPDGIYHAVQKFDGPHHRLSRYLKEKSKKFLRLNEEVSTGIVKYVIDETIPADVVICGHTHMALKTFFPKENIWYYNTGCWTGDDPPTYITIDDYGEMQLREFLEPEEHEDRVDAK